MNINPLTPQTNGIWFNQETKGFINVTKFNRQIEDGTIKPSGKHQVVVILGSDPTGYYICGNIIVEAGTDKMVCYTNPSITFSSDSVDFQVYRFGSNVGTCFCGVDIILRI